LGKIQQTNKLTANDNDVNNPQGKMIFSVVWGNITEIYCDSGISANKGHLRIYLKKNVCH
jgi:hypothetical protein